MNKLKVDENIIDCNVLYLIDSKLARIMQINSNGWETVVITGKGIDVSEHKLDFAF